MNILFVCVQNSCRSQIAEYLANKFNTNPSVKFYSCGSKITTTINQKAVIAIRELYGDDISNQKPKLFNEVPTPDIIISMGCEIGCPVQFKKFDDNWQLPDPKNLNQKQFNIIVKKIEQRVLELLNNM